MWRIGHALFVLIARATLITQKAVEHSALIIQLLACAENITLNATRAELKLSRKNIIFASKMNWFGF